MALNELATNAAKYGALSMPQGYVEVVRSLHPVDTEEADTLDLLWHERGSRSVVATTQRGFGSRLIEDDVSYQLGGVVELHFLRKGVECRFQIPVALRSGGT